MNRDLNRVRRLIKAGRYTEAGLLLKETRHPGVKNVAKELDGLMYTEQPQARLITRATLTVGGIVGLLFALFSAITGTHNPLVLLTVFGLGAILGMLLPEISSRRQKTYEMFYNMWVKRR